MIQSPPLSTRVATLSLAISALLLASASHAATIGKTHITSEQYQPLSASIDVSDIDPNNFSVAVAPKSIYQQMNMSANTPINVRFEKTSNSTGKIIVTSSQPVSDPFTDVVLTVNDKGRQQAVPKTLLLPLAKSAQTNKSPPQTIGASPRPNLPETSHSFKTIQEAPKPLSVQKSAPPPLLPGLTAPVKSAQSPRNTSTIAAKPRVATTTTTASSAANSSLMSPASSTLIRPVPSSVAPIIITPIITPEAPSDSQAPVNAARTESTEGTPNQQAGASATNTASSMAASSFNEMLNASHATNKQPSDAPTPTAPKVSDTQLEVLTTHITRQYKAIEAGQPSKKQILPLPIFKNLDDSASQATDQAANTGMLTPFSNDADSLSNSDNPTDTNIATGTDTNIGTGTQNNDLEALDSREAIELTEAIETTATPKANEQATSVESSRRPSSNAPSQDQVGIPLGDETYVVQRNDNLWTIAHQIASKNNMNINQVMNQIQAYNPDAFINGEKSKLLANAELNLPAYTVIPSKLGIEAAREARRAERKGSQRPSNQQSSSNKNKPSNSGLKAKAKKSRSSQTPKRANTAAQVNKPQTEPRLSIVTPGKKGKATGTGTENNAAATNNGIDSQLITTLQSARLKTASSAKRVNDINEKLSEQTRKLQIQNQQLANLQKRLKLLNAQK